jgi:plastocyanin
MKARMFLPLALAIFMLVSGRAVVVMAQQWTAESALDGSTREVQPYSHPVPSTAASQAASADATVLITDQGLVPSQATVQPGGVVTWVNQTATSLRLVSGYPRAVYLPVVMRNAAAGASTLAASAVTMAAVWGGELAPGGIYTNTFAEAGNYPYFIAGHPDWMGLVVARSGSQGRNLDEIVRGIRILASVQDMMSTCPTQPWSPPYYAYYASEAFLDHGFGDSYQTLVSLQLNGAGRVIGYRALVKDAEPAGSPDSFQHQLQGIRTAGNTTHYTGTFTSTLYAPFTYTVAISYSGMMPNHFTVVKDYGNSEVYQIELADIEYWATLRSSIKRYVATVYGGIYSGITQTVTTSNNNPIPAPEFCN